MNSTDSQAVEGRIDGMVRPLRERLHNCLAMMQPHQRERLTGALLFEATEEIDRLHEWADGFSDAQLRERAACEAHLSAMRDTIGEIAVRIAKDATYRHRAVKELLALALRPNVSEVCTLQTRHAVTKSNQRDRPTTELEVQYGHLAVTGKVSDDQVIPASSFPTRHYPTARVLCEQIVWMPSPQASSTRTEEPEPRRDTHD